MWLVTWMYTVDVEQSRMASRRPMGSLGWVSLEGEGASAQSLDLAGVSGSGLGPPEHSGPDTPEEFP